MKQLVVFLATCLALACGAPERGGFADVERIKADCIPRIKRECKAGDTTCPVYQQCKALLEAWRLNYGAP